MRGLDINILVRYLSADDPQQCAAAERVIEESIQTGESLLPDGDSPL
jgi:predicted nucleic-acid-binding protein